MDADLLDYLTWIAAVGTGHMGGLLFAFSNVVVPSSLTLPPRYSLGLMQRINDDIINPLFGLLFFGTAVASAAIIPVSIAADLRPGAIAGALFYLIGFIGITRSIHIPLNNRLARMDPVEAASDDSWQRLNRRWLRFNHVRALACTVASILLIGSVIGN